MLEVGLRRSAYSVVGLFRSAAPMKLGNSPGERGLSITGLRRPGLLLRGAPRLVLRRLDERRVPCRERVEKGLLVDMLPGLLASCWEWALGESGLRRLSLVVRLTGRWKEINGVGLRRCSDGERRVRKLWDLAFRILAGWCLWCGVAEDRGPFSRC